MVNPAAEAAEHYASCRQPSMARHSPPAMNARPDGTTHPNAPMSAAELAPLALHFVFPPEVANLVIDLEAKLELGRDAADPEPATSGTSGTFAVIPHATVSRRHAAIGESIGGRVPTLLDRGGRNGTFVNGAPLSGAVPLQRHTVVRFGDVLAVVDERAPIALAESPLPGTSAAIAALREALPRVARDHASVLIVGETGTGKERLAAEVHRLSSRGGPLLKFNCAELSPHLVESQLFGHERGAFTGATASHEGLFVAADGGTLFLDELAEIPSELQAKLLRVLEEGEVRPLGSARTRKVDVRVVSATNANLLERVERGQFRRDLYARISYLELLLPPLRERKQDILPWFDRFCRSYGEERGIQAKLMLRPPVAELLLLSHWPDNLRGLNRLVHRLLAAGTTQEVGMRAVREAMPELLPSGTERGSSAPPAAPVSPGASVSPPRAVSDRPPREEFLAVYEANGHSVRATSKHYGKDRRQVYRWLEQFGIARGAGEED
jgi:DNA-binding NtrC family response regulator